MRALILTLALVGCASGDVQNQSQTEGATAADKEAIRRVVRDHLKEVRQCYYKTLETSPGAEGKLVVEWEIGTQGDVTSAKVKSADKNIETAGPCVTELVRTWKFPAPRGDQVVNISYPFYFSENNKFAPAADGQK